MKMVDIKKMVPNEEVDYLFLNNALQSYANPRAKITSFLRSKELIRVKKGLYILNGVNQHSFCKETLANLIYGPSYISLEYALGFYGFIPERVEMLTSVTSKKDKLFKTPVGVFSYRYLNPIKYSVGVTQILYDKTHPILMATPEKALADKVALASPHIELNEVKELEDFLFVDLRIPEVKIITLNKKLFSRIVKIYQNKNLFFFNSYLLGLGKKSG